MKPRKYNALTCENSQSIAVLFMPLHSKVILIYKKYFRKKKQQQKLSQYYFSKKHKKAPLKSTNIAAMKQLKETPNSLKK